MSGDPRKVLPVGFLRQERERQARFDTPLPTTRPHLEHRLAHAIELKNEATLAACLEKLDALPADERAAAPSRALPRTDDDEPNDPLLVVAAEAGRADLVRRFLAWGADVDTCDERGASALASACHQLGRSDAADAADAALALIEAGADLEILDPYGMRALHHAAAAGSVTVIRALVDAGAEVDAVDPQGRGTTPLHEAAEEGHAQAVRLLLAAGATLDGPSRDPFPPILAAVARGHAETVAVLLQAGADALTAEENGRNGLHHAARHGDLDIVRMLAAAGADLKARDEAGVTPEEILLAFGDEALLAELGRHDALRRGIPDDRRITIFCQLVLQNVPGHPQYDDRFCFAGLLHERQLWLAPRGRRLGAAIRGLASGRQPGSVVPNALAWCVYRIFENAQRCYLCTQNPADGFSVDNLDEDALEEEFCHLDGACNAFFIAEHPRMDRMTVEGLAAFESLARQIRLGRTFSRNRAAIGRRAARRRTARPRRR